jgi:signal transduction histidine kinase
MRETEAVIPLLGLRLSFESVLTLGRRAVTYIAPVFRTSMLALLTAITYYAGSQIGFLLTPHYTPISTFWPPNAILLAILLLTPSRIWWVLLLAALPAHLLVQLRTGIPLISALGWFAGNAGEALLGAACIRLLKKDKPLFESVHGVLVFLAFGVFLPTFATSFLDAGGVILSGLGRNYWKLWTARLTSNIVSDVTIVPIILAFGLSAMSRFRRTNLARYFEAGALTFSVVGVSLLVFTRESSANGIPAFIYAPLVPLVWTAVRFGFGGLSMSLLATALIALWNTVHARGPLGMQAPVDAVISLRVLLITFDVPLMLLAAMIAERQREEEILRSTRNKLIYAQEQECHRVARHLHTKIAGRLTLLGLSVDEFRSDSDVSVRPRLEQLHREISRVCLDTLNLSHEVHAFSVEYLGLANALKRLCRERGLESDVAIRFSAENVPPSIPSDISQRLFRVAKTALDNVVQHSQAKAASVELEVSGGCLLLRVADAGIGMSPESAEGMGLTWMREQLLSLKGTFKISSAPQAGTVIEASVPIMFARQVRRNLSGLSGTREEGETQIVKIRHPEHH